MSYFLLSMKYYCKHTHFFFLIVPAPFNFFFQLKFLINLSNPQECSSSRHPIEYHWKFIINQVFTFEMNCLLISSSLRWISWTNTSYRLWSKKLFWNHTIECIVLQLHIVMVKNDCKNLYYILHYHSFVCHNL